MQMPTVSSYKEVQMLMHFWQFKQPPGWIPS